MSVRQGDQCEALTHGIVAGAAEMQRLFGLRSGILELVESKMALREIRADDRLPAPVSQLLGQG